MEEKVLKNIILESRKKESTLRYISSHILDNLSNSEKDNILTLIKKYYLDCANILETTRNYLINVEDEMYEIRCERKDTKKVAEEIINEFATMVITLKAEKILNQRLQEKPISEGAYLFLLEELKHIAKKYDIKIGEKLWHF